MKQALQVCGVVAVMLVMTALKPAAQSATVKGDVLKDWTGLKDTLVKLANAMPEDKYTYKSTPAQRDFSQQVLHIAQVNVMLLQLVGGKAAPPMIDGKATRKADVIKAMSDSFDYGTALINEQTDQSMIETVQARFLGPSTRARLFYFLVGHTWDIYGQMAVYLRLSGGVPPASQRP
jgi:uncharacterized damage-inducible protein DinB